MKRPQSLNYVLLCGLCPSFCCQSNCCPKFTRIESSSQVKPSENPADPRRAPRSAWREPRVPAKASKRPSKRLISSGALEEDCAARPLSSTLYDFRSWVVKDSQHKWPSKRDTHDIERIAAQERKPSQHAKLPKRQHETNGKLGNDRGIGGKRRIVPIPGFLVTFHDNNSK